MTLAGARCSTICHLLSPPLILLTAFINFIKYNHYSYAAPEFWICVAGLVALGLLCGTIMALGGIWLRVLGTAGLLTLFVDFQSEWFEDQLALRVSAFALVVLVLCWVVRNNLHRVTLSVFATMLTAAVVLPGSSSEWSVRIGARRGDTQAVLRPAPPAIIHLIFDEFIGIEGIPLEAAAGNAVRHSLRSFLHENGFRVFGRACSRFHRTDNAIPNMLNYASMPKEAYFMEENSKRLKQNQYFNDMLERGYRIHVYQPHYIDFCEGYENQIASCHTFFAGIKSLELLPLSTVAKADLILQNFGRLSASWRVGTGYYVRIIRKAVTYGYLSLQWIPASPQLWSAGGLHMLDVVARNVANGAPGDLHFAHLPTPHSAYVYDRSCNLRNPDDWVDRPSPVPRLGRYMLYLEQVECIRKKLQYALGLWGRAKMFDQAKVIIQGDHGSRLYLKEPTVDNRDELRESDYVDSFSTLLAVKAPGLEPKYDEQMVAIQDALAAVPHDRPLDQLSGRDKKPYVLLRNLEGVEMIRRPMPEFGDIRVE